MNDRDVEMFVLEELREYIVYNDIVIWSRDDLLKTFIEIREDGYLYEIEEAGKMRIARAILNKFADEFEKDKDLLEKDLIIMGPRIVLEKMDKTKKNKC